MPTPDYIDIPIITDADELAQEAYDYLQGAIPGWSPATGNLETWLIEATARIGSILGTLASSVPTTIFRWFGANLAGVPPIDAQPATVTTTWTAQDDAGYTIPDGTQIAIAAAGDTLIPFQTVGDVVIAPGDTTTSPGEVTIVAIDPGANGSGLGGVGAPVELLDTLAFITSISMSAATTGGVDAEDDQTYLNRLAAYFTLITPRPILPSQFSMLARQIAGVTRCFCLDGYNPADDTTDNPRMVCVFPIDAAGAAVGSGIETEVVDYLQGLREVNFVVNVDAPTYTEIDVDYTVAVQSGFDPTVVVAAATQALTDMLDPANWGIPRGDDQPDWEATPTVRYTDVAAAIKNTLGVEYIDALTIGVHGGAMADTDIALAGAAPLTTVGTITGAHT